MGAIASITQRTNWIGSANAIRIAADYSFTLYLIHHTIMYSAKFAFDGQDGGWFLGTVVLSNLIAYLIAQPFEMRHKQIAKWIVSLPVSLREEVRHAVFTLDNDKEERGKAARQAAQGLFNDEMTEKNMVLLNVRGLFWAVD